MGVGETLPPPPALPSRRGGSPVDTAALPAGGWTWALGLTLQALSPSQSVVSGALWPRGPLQISPGSCPSTGAGGRTRLVACSGRSQRAGHWRPGPRKPPVKQITFHSPSSHGRRSTPHSIVQFWSSGFCGVFRPRNLTLISVLHNSPQCPSQGLKRATSLLVNKPARAGLTVGGGLTADRRSCSEPGCSQAGWGLKLP